MHFFFNKKIHSVKIWKKKKKSPAGNVTEITINTLLLSFCVYIVKSCVKKLKSGII